MNPATRRLLVFAGLLSAVLVIALLVQQAVVIVVSAAVAAVVAILVHRSLSAGDTSEETSEAPDETEAWIAHLQDLVRLNIQIREGALSREVTEKLEHSIDVLREVIPQLNDEHIGSELTWTVNKMATDYLPRIVAPFVSLGAAARQEHEPELLKSLQGFEAELENIVSLLRDAKVGEFKTKAAFLRARFLDGGLG